MSLTGCVSAGSYARNPVNQEAVPIWVADYVLGSYGSGAIMAVPAHDSRDYDFALQFGLPVRQVVQPNAPSQDAPLPFTGHSPPHPPPPSARPSTHASHTCVAVLHSCYGKSVVLLTHRPQVPNCCIYCLCHWVTACVQKRRHALHGKQNVIGVMGCDSSVMHEVSSHLELNSANLIVAAAALGVDILSGIMSVTCASQCHRGGCGHELEHGVW